jgi:hypothetical protein
MVPRRPYNLLKLLYFLYSRFFEEWNPNPGDIDGDAGNGAGDVLLGAMWPCFLQDN